MSEATGPEFQAQCWFMVCQDCGECVESMDVHCGGRMRGQFPVLPDAYAEVSRAYSGYVADCREVPC